MLEKRQVMYAERQKLQKGSKEKRASCGLISPRRSQWACRRSTQTSKLNCQEREKRVGGKKLTVQEPWGNCTRGNIHKTKFQEEKVERAEK